MLSGCDVLVAEGGEHGGGIVAIGNGGRDWVRVFIWILGVLQIEKISGVW